MTIPPPSISEEEHQRRAAVTQHATESERKMLRQYWATLDAGLFIVCRHEQDYSLPTMDSEPPQYGCKLCGATYSESR